MTSNSSIKKYVHSEKGKHLDIPYLFIDEGTRIFYVRKRIGNRTFTRSLETSDFRTAKIRINEKIAEMSGEKPKKQNTLLRDYYQALIEQKISEDTKPQTLIRIENIWKASIEPYWGDLTPDDINPNMMTDFITWHRRKRPGIQFINVYKYLGNLFRFMVRQGVLNQGKVPDLILPKEEKRHHLIQKGTYITDAEFDQICSKINLPRNLLIVHISYSYGMRLQEICSLRKDKIDFKKKTINLTAHDTKTGYGRIIPLSESHFSELRQLFKKNSDFVFPCMHNLKKPIPTQIVDRSFRLAVKASGIGRRVNFHSLRHTCASNLAKANVNPSVACTILGMSIQVYQKRYLKLGADDLRLALVAVSNVKGGKK